LSIGLLKIDLYDGDKIKRTLDSQVSRKEAMTYILQHLDMGKSVQITFIGNESEGDPAEKILNRKAH
jgi:hypothetical protein